jgi:23S rRNA-/tRNA-specific pseudouridylate synthase
MAGRPLWELCARATGLGPDEARALVAFGAVWLGRGVALDPGHPLPAKGAFRVNFPAYGPREFYEPDPGRVAFEDKDILVYRKEANRPSQAVPYDARNNVLAGLTRQRGVFLRLAHRLDLGTSGLLLLAKSLKAAGFLGKSFQRGQIAKRYLALSSGPPPPWDETEVTAPIARVQNRFVARENGPGLPSRTILRPLAAFEGRVLFLATPRTGRTHQIRLHLSHLGYPIVGDCFYGGAPHPRLMLAASGLAFRHPSSREPMALGGPWGGDPPDLG